MKSNRRDFIKKLASIAIVTGAFPFIRCSPGEPGLNVLVLGGTNFVGPAIVEAGIANGHQVTLFNRGKTNPGLFPDLPLIQGDRNAGPSAYVELARKKWDVVIDVWPEKAQLVDEATHALRAHAGHYVFISSIAVYRDFQEVGLNEQSEVVEPGPEKEDWGYPEEKIMAEQLVASRFPENHTILRPGPIKGWRDPAIDLAYWLVKLKRNETILAPGTGKDPLQFIDVKDLGRFAFLAIEHHLNGVYNCAGPRKEILRWKEFLALAQNHISSTSELYWPSEHFLSENQVYSFSDLPLWAPLSEDKGFMQISMEKAIAVGFQFTPIDKTIQDCLLWFEKHQDANVKFGVGEEPVGLDRVRELRLIEEWKAQG